MGIRRGACESSPNPREQTRTMSKRCARLWALLGTNSTHRAPFSISTTRNLKCWSWRFLDSRVYGNAVLPKRNSSEPHKSSARRISAHGCASSDYSLGPQYDKVDASRRIGTDRSEGRLCSDPVSVCRMRTWAIQFLGISMISHLYTVLVSGPHSSGGPAWRA